ncbi:MAG TPA: metal-dependent hydrolase [Actinocrinis sp.]|nr:metal-dependent hydrolase [Actinocrinis sp.]
MLITNHVLSGAVIGAAAANPAAALPLGVASHFALDALPHWGKWLSKSHFLRVAVADGLTGLAVMGAAAAVTPPARRAAVVAGMLGAALPDVDKPTRIFFGFSPFPRRVDDFHSRIQDEAPGRFYSHEVVAAALFTAGFTALTVAARVKDRARARAEATEGADRARDASTPEGGATGADGSGRGSGSSNSSGSGARARSGLFARARASSGLLAAMRACP